MRRVFRALIAISLALALTGGASLTFAATTGHIRQTECAKPSSGCHEASFTCACCDHGGAGTSTPALPTSDRTSVSKAPSGTAVLLPAAVITALSSLARDLNASSTRRAGPPISLSILHASLLL